MGYRLDKGGHIDRSQQIHFRWNGRKIPAYAGDTVASALLANDVAIVGRGMKLHRPRGVFSIGPEEPNAFVSLGRGAELEPSARATMIPVREGLEVRAQNAWPGVGFDLGRTLDRTAGLWHAGFYNKTFMWPSWDFWEPWIRRAAGIAKAPRERDPARYDAVHAHCDLLVVGGGPAGLLAAQIASRAGLRVMLAEQDFECGGRLLATNTLINDAPVITWFASVLGELAASRNVTLLTATTCFGLYDHGMAGLLQRLDLGNKPSAVRQRYWRVHAKQTLLATGAIEQPLVFEQNDLPGIMLSGAIRQYANRYGVAAGKQIVLATNNDSAYLAALDLVAAGAPVAVLLDSRTEAPADLAKWLRAQHVEVRSGTSVVKAIGRKRLERVQLSAGEDIDCDALGVSGGWQPAVHLWSHARAPVVYDEASRSFRPEGSRPPLQAVGSLNGCTSLDESFADTMSAIRHALEQIGRPGDLQVARPTVQEAPLSPEVAVPPRAEDGKTGRQWLDYLHDVTVADAEIALAEGYEHIELLKRYTTCGMAADQGKTSNLNALLTVASMTAKGPAEVGTTTFRPPYTPVTLGALAGRQVGERYAVKRLLPAHAEHEALGAHWWEAGGWMRPACYLKKGETPHQAVQREASAVRAGVGIFDASPLGKIEVTGPDAAKFLERFYVNNVAKLDIGRVRYGLMLNENGAIIDDGTVARLEREHFRRHDDERRRLAHRGLARGMAPVRMAGPRSVRHARHDAVGDLCHRGPARAAAPRAIPHRHRLRLALDAAHEHARRSLCRRARAALSRELLRRARLRDQRAGALWRVPLERTPESRRRFRRDAVRRRDRAAAPPREGLPARGRGYRRHDRPGRRRLGRDRGEAQRRFHRQALALASGQPARGSPAARRADGRGR